MAHASAPYATPRRIALRSDQLVPPQSPTSSESAKATSKHCSWDSAARGELPGRLPVVGPPVDHELVGARARTGGPLVPLRAGQEGRGVGRLGACWASSSTIRAAPRSSRSEGTAGSRCAGGPLSRVRCLSVVTLRPVRPYQDSSALAQYH